MQIQIVYKEPGKPPERRIISGDLPSLQPLVGGHLELVRGVYAFGGEPVDLWCNEDAHRLRLAPHLRLPTGDIVHGPVFFAAYDREDIVGLTDEQVQEIIDAFSRGR